MSLYHRVGGGQHRRLDAVARARLAIGDRLRDRRLRGRRPQTPGRWEELGDGVAGVKHLAPPRGTGIGVWLLLTGVVGNAAALAKGRTTTDRERSRPWPPVRKSSVAPKHRREYLPLSHKRPSADGPESQGTFAWVTRREGGHRWGHAHSGGARPRSEAPRLACFSRTESSRRSLWGSSDRRSELVISLSSQPLAILATTVVFLRSSWRPHEQVKDYTPITTQGLFASEPRIPLQ